MILLKVGIVENMILFKKKMLKIFVLIIDLLIIILLLLIAEMLLTPLKQLFFAYF
jgi:hypothetical protein